MVFNILLHKEARWPTTTQAGVTHRPVVPLTLSTFSIWQQSSPGRLEQIMKKLSLWGHKFHFWLLLLEDVHLCMPNILGNAIKLLVHCLCAGVNANGGVKLYSYWVSRASHTFTHRALDDCGLSICSWFFSVVLKCFSFAIIPPTWSWNIYGERNFTKSQYHVGTENNSFFHKCL